MKKLKDGQGKQQSLNRSCHKSLGALPSNQLSNQNRVGAPFLTILDVQDLNRSKRGIIPAKKKTYF